MASLPGDRGPSPAPEAERLAAALAGMGVRAAVEAQGRLAMLTLRDRAGLPASAVRAAIVAAAREAGFQSVAVDVTAADATNA